MRVFLVMAAAWHPWLPCRFQLEVAALDNPGMYSLSSLRHPMFLAVCLSLLLLLGLPPAAAQNPSAAAPANPYEAVVPVDDNSASSRQKGLRVALIQVLQRVVGRSDSATTAVLARASSLVQYDAFQRDAASGEWRLRAIFDARAVDAAIKSQGLPVFGVDADVVESWAVNVAGVRNAADYARVMRHFETLRGVRRVDLQELQDAQLSLRLVVEGGVSRLETLATADGLLREDGAGGYVLAR